MSEPGRKRGDELGTGRGPGVTRARHGVVGAHLRVGVCVRACVRGPSTGYLVRETYAHVIACPS